MNPNHYDREEFVNSHVNYIYSFVEMSKFIMHSERNFYLTLFIITIPLFVQAEIKKYDYRDIYIDPQSFERSVLQARQLIVKWCAQETEDCARLHSMLIELTIIVELAPEVASNVTIGAVDCVKHWQFCSDKNMTVYPNLLLIEQQRKLYKEIYDPFYDLFSLLELLQLPDLRSLSDFRVERVPVYCSHQQVLSLAPEDFSTIIPEGIFFIQFFQSPCFTCRAVSSKWKALANRMNQANAKVCIAEFECATGLNLSMCKNYDVMKVPSVMWFEYGKMVRKYTGQFITTDLERFAIEMIRLNGSYKSITPLRGPYKSDTSSIFAVKIYLVSLIVCSLAIL